MKKFIALAMVMALCVTTLVACGNNETEDETPSNTTEVTDTENPENTEGTDGEGTGMEIGDPDATVVATENERLAMIIDSGRTEEQIENFPADTTNENDYLTVLGLNEDMVSEYAVAYSPVSVHAYMVAILKPVEGQEEAVETALNTYKETIIGNYQQYLPDQLAIAEAAEVFNSDGYMGIVMCDNSADVMAAINDGLADIDSIVVDPDAASSNTGITVPSDEGTTDVTIDGSGNPTEEVEDNGVTEDTQIEEGSGATGAEESGAAEDAAAEGGLEISDTGDATMEEVTEGVVEEGVAAAEDTTTTTTTVE